MPVTDCSEGGKPGFKWGNSGACYTYDPKDAASRAAARVKAAKQGTAEAFSRAKARGYGKPSKMDFK